MICYIDEVKWRKDFAEVPAALQEKRANEMGEALDRQFPTTYSGNGWVQIDLSHNPNARQEIYGYLQRAGIACVDVQPADVFYLCGGKNFASLALTRALEQGTVNLTTVEPSELFDRLDAALRQVQFPAADAVTDGPEVELEQAIALNDLVSTGLLKPEDAGDDWTERERKAYADREAAFDQTVREEIARREEAAFDPFYSESGDVW